jgi:hypothetical protein
MKTFWSAIAMASSALFMAGCAQNPNGCRDNYAQIYVPGTNGGAGTVMPVYTGTRCDARMLNRWPEAGNSSSESSAGPLKPGMPGYEDGETHQESGRDDEVDS